ILDDLRQGLSIIRSRTEALGRFMTAYAQLARLPQPKLLPVRVSEWVGRSVKLETRVKVSLGKGPDAVISADPDQLEQLLINLIRNAADAALETNRSEEHTSELQSLAYLVCRLLLEYRCDPHHLHSFPTRRSSDLATQITARAGLGMGRQKRKTGDTCESQSREGAGRCHLGRPRSVRAVIDQSDSQCRGRGPGNE